jgi:hypothetical protein
VEVGRRTDIDDSDIYCRVLAFGQMLTFPLTEGSLNSGPFSFSGSFIFRWHFPTFFHFQASKSISEVDLFAWEIHLDALRKFLMARF